jgi:hypothetical protein
MKKLKHSFLVIFCIIKIIISYGQENSRSIINLKQMQKIGSVDERYQSFNVEMCEVIGGDFWIPYEKLDSVKKATGKKMGFAALKWKIEPINLYEKKIRNLAKALGPTYVRVSGTWANDVYFQNDDNPKIIAAPIGFRNVLTREQWKGVVDFCTAVNGKLITSFPISDGMYDKKGNWKSDQVKSILDYTKQIGGEIFGAEMFNEPSHASHGNAPKGYNGDNYVKDFAAFKSFVRQAVPDMKILGPGSTGEGGILEGGLDIPVDKLLSPEPRPIFDVFTYHYYGTVSKRCFGGQDEEKAMTKEWLSKTEKGLDFYEKVRDTYMPGTPIWLTETAETACGGNPLAATYIDSFRYLEQLGRLAKKGVQVVMHNTLARSEYGLLEHDTHNPRPNYWAALLWNKFMGTQVYDAGNLALDVDIFAHNLKGKPEGRSLLILNPKDKEALVNVPIKGKLYLLTADVLLTKKIKLNGKDLDLTSDDRLPVIKGKNVKKGDLKLPPNSIAFLTFDRI